MYVLAFDINQATILNIGEYHCRCYFVNIKKEAKGSPGKCKI